MIQYFYTFQNDHHDKSSCHLTPYKDITQLLTIFPTLTHFIAVTHLFCNWKFVPQSPSPISLLPATVKKLPLTYLVTNHLKVTLGFSGRWACVRISNTGIRIHRFGSSRRHNNPNWLNTILWYHSDKSHTAGRLHWTAGPARTTSGNISSPKTERNS